MKKISLKNEEIIHKLQSCIRLNRAINWFICVITNLLKNSFSSILVKKIHYSIARIMTRPQSNCCVTCNLFPKQPGTKKLISSFCLRILKCHRHNNPSQNHILRQLLSTDYWKCDFTFQQLLQYLTTTVSSFYSHFTNHCVRCCSKFSWNILSLDH